MEEETHVPNQLDLGKEYVGSQEGMSLMYYTHQFEIEVDWRCVINYDFPNQIEDVRVCHVFLIQILSQSRMHIRNHIICHIPISFKYQITAFWIYMT